MKIPVVKTKRLILRPYNLGDFSAWKAAYRGRGPRKNRFESPVSKAILTKKGFAKWLDEKRRLQKKDLVYVFGIFHRDTGDIIGSIDIAVFKRIRIQCANLGYAIHNQYWNQGFATEAVMASYKLAFKYLKLHRLEAAIDPRNAISLRVARRSGMTREGLRKRFFFFDGKWLDCIVFVKNAEECGIKNCKPTIKPRMLDYL